MNLWIEGSRPHTLIASISPVLIGTIIALDTNNFDLFIFLASLIFALCIQVGMNFANDYIDFIKGADTSDRKGPRRLVQSGLVSVKTMRKATIGIFFLAGLIGIYLMIIGGWQIGVLTFFAILLGYMYTGGPFPLGYLGLADLFVLVFFGPVAVTSVTYLQTGSISSIAIIAGFGPGFISTALIAINNLRDIEEDAKANKKTLPVRFGRQFGIWEVTFCLILPCFIPVFLIIITNSHFLSLISTGCLIFTFPLIHSLFKENQFSSLFPKIGKFLILYTLLFMIGWIFS